MLRNKKAIYAALLGAAFLAFPASSPCAPQEAQQAHAQRQSPVPWEHGPTVGKLGDIAQIVVPQGFRFTGKAGTQKVLELTQNPTSGNEIGALVPEPDSPYGFWFVIFEFDATGYVKDDDKGDLKPDAILSTIQKGTEESNKIRQQRGWPAFHVTGWSHQPYYDPQTNNLTWAILGKSQQQGKLDEESVNYSVRILGRRGTMSVDLVLAPDLVPKVIPEFNKLMDGFSYISGQKYADWRKGDKVAEYGLTALIVGGAAAAALKSGLLVKFWKLIVAVFVGLGAFIKRLFAWIKRLITGKASEEMPQHE